MKEFLEIQIWISAIGKAMGAIESVLEKSDLKLFDEKAFRFI